MQRAIAVDDVVVAAALDDVAAAAAHQDVPLLPDDAGARVGSRASEAVQRALPHGGGVDHVPGRDEVRRVHEVDVVVEAADPADAGGIECVAALETGWPGDGLPFVTTQD